MTTGAVIRDLALEPASLFRHPVTLSPTAGEPLGKWPNVSVPQFPHLQNKMKAMVVPTS